MEPLLRPIKRALISVSDKEGIVEFAKELEKRNVEILSTGGTAKLLTEKGIKVIEVSDYTKFPEMMDGRVKTLHPKIHGGILGRRGIDEDVMNEHDIKPIDLVVVNLYPFVKTVSDPNCPLEKATEASLASNMFFLLREDSIKTTFPPSSLKGLGHFSFHK